MRKIWTFILTLVIIVLVGVAAFLFGQSKGQNVDTAVKTEVNENQMGDQVSSPSATPIISSAPSPTSSSANNPVVVFEAQGSISATDLSELKARVTNPYVDYHAEATPGTLVSLTVSPNLQPSKTTYPYQASAVYKNGGNEGFLISKNAGHIDWWRPECINGCVFSDAFKAKYPETVKQ